ncbi:MAG: hypothetical protein QM692_15405 [Thermomicrobiales bacterium]
MDDTTFDEMARRAAQQTTRRAALGALMGGALLLGDPGASEANNAGKRRKQQKKKSVGLYRGFHITINNANGTAPAVVRFGDSGSFDYCRQFANPTIPAGGGTYFQTHRTSAWLWIDTGQQYWFQFHNFLGGAPFYRIAVHGQANIDRNFNCLFPQGDIVEEQWALNPNSARYYDINGHLFHLSRQRDSKRYKIFTLLLPPTL